MSLATRAPLSHQRARHPPSPFKPHKGQAGPPRSAPHRLLQTLMCAWMAGPQERAGNHGWKGDTVEPQRGDCNVGVSKKKQSLGVANKGGSNHPAHPPRGCQVCRSWSPSAACRMMWAWWRWSPWLPSTNRYHHQAHHPAASGGSNRQANKTTAADDGWRSQNSPYPILVHCLQQGHSP
jgi:hypothetical protein